MLEKSARRDERIGYGRKEEVMNSPSSPHIWGARSASPSDTARHGRFVWRREEKYKKYKVWEGATKGKRDY